MCEIFENRATRLLTSCDRLITLNHSRCIRLRFDTVRQAQDSQGDAGRIESRGGIVLDAINDQPSSRGPLTFIDMMMAWEIASHHEGNEK
jgi:hypothetical protein